MTETPAQQTTMSAAERAAELEQARREYHPCGTGIHLCGQIEDEHDERPLTLGNFPAKSSEDARRLFAALRSEFEEDQDDILVDLMVDDCMCEDNFHMTRQMIPRLAARVKELANG